jgi:4-nitrophenyl phosphatase
VEGAERCENAVLSSREEARYSLHGFELKALDYNGFGLQIWIMAIKNIIFDMDGVLYRGETAIPGAGEAVAALRKKGMKIFFFTNNAEKTRKQFVERLNSFGVFAKEEEVYTTSYGAAVYIKKNLPGKKVFAFSSGTIEELKKHGIPILLTKKAEVVVAGLDLELNYGKLADAVQAINSGAAFIATNEDNSYPVEDAILPGAGAIVAALSSTTGVKPVLIGKPEPYLLDIMIKEHKLKKDETLMVGDRLQTDILMANREGLHSALVLSGISTREEIEKCGLIPDFVLDSVAELPGILKK